MTDSKKSDENIPEIGPKNSHVPCELCKVLEEYLLKQAYLSFFDSELYLFEILKKYSKIEIMKHPINEKYGSLYGHASRMWHFTANQIGTPLYRLIKAKEY